jgi:hypothetical protein
MLFQLIKYFFIMYFIIIIKPMKTIFYCSSFCDCCYIVL